jgi:hypothetical protein
MLSLCGAAVGCRPGAPPETRPLVLVVSGDTAGWIVPCGCTSNQSGGLPRRAACLAELRRRGEVVVADAGGAPGGKSAYDRFKFEAILQGEKAMGIDAHNVGAAEAALGADYLREAGRKWDIPFLSTNVLTAGVAAGDLLAPPVRIVARAGRRLAILGVLSPRHAAPGLRIVPPREAVLDTLRRIAGQYDSVVVLAYLAEEELTAFAEGLPEADAVIGGPTGQAIAPRRIGPTLLASATRQGKFLVQLEVPPGSPARWHGQIVELTGRFPDDAGQAANIARFRAALGQRDFTVAETSLASTLLGQLPDDFTVAGSPACAKCHAEDDRAWRRSRHARAWQSLEKSMAQVDPECQRCHATGYGLPGGFQSARRSAALVQVGCESCHGPSGQHVRDPKVHTACFAEAKNHCTSCHDRENSPKFAYDAYWAKIRHGSTDDARAEK